MSTAVSLQEPVGLDAGQHDEASIDQAECERSDPVRDTASARNPGYLAPSRPNCQGSAARAARGILRSDMVASRVFIGALRHVDGCPSFTHRRRHEIAIADKHAIGQSTISRDNRSARAGFPDCAVQRRFSRRSHPGKDMRLLLRMAGRVTSFADQRSDTRCRRPRQSRRRALQRCWPTGTSIRKECAMKKRYEKPLTPEQLSQLGDEEHRHQRHSRAGRRVLGQRQTGPSDAQHPMPTRATRNRSGFHEVRTDPWRQKPRA